MKIESIVVGALAVNCYLIYCSVTKTALVLDPGADAGSIINLVYKRGLKLASIVLTHGHWDHVGAAGTLRRETGCAIYCHEAEVGLLLDADHNLSVYLEGGSGCSAPQPDGLLKHGEYVGVGHIKFQVLHTPGHTPGGICLYGNGIVFTGDTLFAGAVGRTDLPGGDPAALRKSIKKHLVGLPDDTVIYPGHGPVSTIGLERRDNPYLF